MLILLYRRLAGRDGGASSQMHLIGLSTLQRLFRHKPQDITLPGSATRDLRSSGGGHHTEALGDGGAIHRLRKTEHDFRTGIYECLVGHGLDQSHRGRHHGEGPAIVLLQNGLGGRQPGRDRHGIALSRDQRCRGHKHIDRGVGPASLPLNGRLDLDGHGESSLGLDVGEWDDRPVEGDDDLGVRRHLGAICRWEDVCHL